MPPALRDHPSQTTRARRHGWLARPGAVLLEILISIALFAGAAVFTLSAAHSTLESMDRVRLRQEALDLARSRMAMLESGLATLDDLRDELVDRAGDRAGTPAWSIDVQVSRSEFTDLSLVEITVTELLPDGRMPDEDQQATISCTLRQLVPVGYVLAGGERP